jgi:PKD domain
MRGSLVALVLLAAASSAGAASSTSQWVAPTQLTTARADDLGLTMNARGDVLSAWRNKETGLMVVRFRSADSSEWGEPKDLEPAADPWVGPALALDARGNAVVLWAAAGRFPASLWAASRNASTGLWAEPARITDYALDDSFSVSFDAAGNATAAWVQTGTEVRGIASAYRPAGGAWAAPVIVARSSRYSLNFSLSLAANDSTTLLAWLDFDIGGQTRVRAAFGRNGSWDPAETLATDVKEETTSAGLGGDGTAVVGWDNELHGNAVTQAIVRPTGEDWGPPSTLSFEDGQAYGSPLLAVDGRGNATAAWWAGVDYEATYLPAGSEHWQRTVVISEPETLAGDASLAENRQGDTVFVWAAEHNVMANVRPAGATAWGASTPISRDGSSFGYLAISTGLAVDSQGETMAAWQVPDGIQVRGVRAAAFDVAPPRIASMRVPKTGRLLKPLVFSAAFGDISGTTIQWQFGDGVTRSGQKVSHAYRRPGRYVVTVTATDVAGHMSSTSRSLRITR